MAEDAPLLHPALGSNVVSDRSFSYGDPEAAFASAAHVVREHFRHPRSSATPVECYGVIAHWQAGGVTAWANFQGPFTLHGVAAAALGIPGRQAAAAHAVRERRLVRHQGGGAARGRADGDRVALPRRAGALDGGSQRAPARGLHGDRAHERGRGCVRRRRPSARAAARPDRRGRRLRPRARAGHALPHARLPDRGLRRAGSRRAQPRRRQQSRARPGSTAASAARSSTARSSARCTSPRGGSGSIPAELARRNLVRAAADALPRRGRRRLRLGRLPGLPRARARAGRLRRSCAPSRPRRAPQGGCSASGSPAWSSRASPTWATSRSCRAPRSARPASPRAATPRA